MADTAHVLEYKCPCCDSGLHFSQTDQKLSCPSCGNDFELEAVQDYQEAMEQKDDTQISWEEYSAKEWTAQEEAQMQSFLCPSCSGEIVSDGSTAATFCPYCENPAILPGRVSGMLKPDGVIPFQTSKEDAKNAFLTFCKKKPLLPKDFASAHRLEKITGIYVPFWLYGCESQFHGRYKATRIHRWSDSKYNYTRTDHFLLTRQSTAQFSQIPMDASKKIDDAIMESIEPYDMRKAVDFDTAYLSGFFADKFDIPAQSGHKRVQERVGSTMNDMLSPTFLGYASVIPTVRNLSVEQGKTRYMLLPVWMLHTKYKDKTYVFAMNGQTGKLTGTLPICPKRSWAWFGGITAAVTLAVSLIQLLVL